MQPSEEKVLPAPATDQTPALKFARWMLLIALIGSFTSPPLSNLAQVILYGMFAASADLRARLWASRKEPMTIGAMAFLLMLAAAAFYSQAEAKVAFTSLWHWHKLLLIPIAATLCVGSDAKFFLLKGFVPTAVVLCVFSSLVYYYDLQPQLEFLVQNRGSGIILRNHGTQGMVFAAAAVAGVILLALKVPAFEKHRIALAGGSVLLVLNIALVTTGRSGYLVLLIGALTCAVGWAYAKSLSPTKIVAVAAGFILAVTAALLIAPKSRERILQGVQEVKAYQAVDAETSMGLRMHFWRTTPSIIAERPLLGWGTGAFEMAYQRAVEGRTGMAGVVTRDPHNQYLKIMAEQGLIGFAVFVYFLVSVLRQRPELLFRVIGLSVFLGWCGTGLANAHFSTFSEGTFLYIWIGAMLASTAHKPS